MGLVWAERRNNTHTLPITRQLRVVCPQAGSFMSVLSVVLLREYQHIYLYIARAIVLFHI